MTVFITQSPKPNNKGWMPDLSSAVKYGEIQYVFDAHERVYALPMPSLFKARKALRNFDPEADYLLHPSSGDQMACTICTLVIAESRPLALKFLIYDRVRNPEDGKPKGFYVPVRIELVKPDFSGDVK